MKMESLWGGLDNHDNLVKALRNFLSNCIGTDVWYVKDKPFIVTSKRHENYKETIMIPVIVSIDKNKEMPDNIEIEI